MSAKTAIEPITSIPELIIEIIPRAFDVWQGSREQLKAEGLIPADFEWPNGAAREMWSANGFDYSLNRQRPPGMKGPMRQWVEGDYWYLRRSLTSEAGTGWGAALIYEKRRELERAIWSQTPACIDQYIRCEEARQDKRFQAFKVLLTGEKASRRGLRAAMRSHTENISPD